MTHLAAVATGGTSMWYLTRATGIVALLLLTATLIVGIVSSVGWTSDRWPRFVSQAIHRNLSLFCLVLVAAHIVTTVADGYVPIGFADAVVPFRTPYRPLWIGLGALSFDLLVAVLVTSALRRRIGYRAWRFVHLLSYACWPVALLHALGSGTDTRLSLVDLVDAACILAVLAALIWRLAAARAVPSPRRVLAGTAAGLATLGIGAFAALGPMRPGWSQRAGTSAALLKEIAAAQSGQSGQSGQSASAPAPARPAPSPAPSSTAPGAQDLPPVPFSEALSGTFTTSSPDPSGDVTVTIATKVGDTGVPLQIRLVGTPVGSGVAMSSSAVALGPYTGTVTELDGSRITAVVAGQGNTLALSVDLSLNPQTTSATGTLHASLASSDEG
jgi:sulfoxide reductase heme-binding subunit YedZ